MNYVAIIKKVLQFITGSGVSAIVTDFIKTTDLQKSIWKKAAKYVAGGVVTAMVTEKCNEYIDKKTDEFVDSLNSTEDEEKKEEEQKEENK